MNGRDGVVLRPTLQGALLAKAAAVEIPGDDHTRHLVDIATLGSLVSRRDRLATDVTETERRRIRAALSLIERDPLICRVADVDPIVVDRLRLAFA
ncbi:hypothetical protein [Frigoribacterium faeni]|uniref:hypothetical protein n=1 Tax=Frigoribacterium faeni TaxID=145483 RepID=UPI0024131192|nr:hypothetical protein [Frigoribacterium faeni]